MKCKSMIVIAKYDLVNTSERMRAQCHDVRCEDDQGGGEASNSNDGSKGEEGDNLITESVGCGNCEVSL